MWLTNFIEHLGREFSNAQTTAAGNVLSLKTTIGSYFGGIINTAEPILSEACDAQTMKRLYDVASCLVRKCAKAIYSKVCYSLYGHGNRRCFDTSQSI